MIKRSLKALLVTGGSGFIGSNFIHLMLSDPSFLGIIVNLDSLTYAGNPLNLKAIEKSDRYHFVKGDIRSQETVETVFSRFAIDTVVHFAAESHVDRSIHGPRDFIETNVVGTMTLLEAARKHWKERDDVLFHHVSTDEVYGSLGSAGRFLETTPYDPRSPYSASKAGSDHLIHAWHHTYNLPITLSNCSNNYGPYQFPEKLIPLMIINMLKEKPLPVYGDGKNIRDWLFVEDHCTGISMILNHGKNGETYNIGGDNEWTNIDLLTSLCEIVAEKKNKDSEYYKKLITFVKDRPGHDRRYAIDCEKIKSELNWKQSVDFRHGLEKTVTWYLSHPEWIASIESGDYQSWIEKQYQ